LKTLIIDLENAKCLKFLVLIESVTHQQFTDLHIALFIGTLHMGLRKTFADAMLHSRSEHFKCLSQMCTAFQNLQNKQNTRSKGANFVLPPHS
jgi:hypothetical protein